MNIFGYRLITYEGAVIETTNSLDVARKNAIKWALANKTRIYVVNVFDKIVDEYKFDVLRRLSVYDINKIFSYLNKKFYLKNINTSLVKYKVSKVNDYTITHDLTVNFYYQTNDCLVGSCNLIFSTNVLDRRNNHVVECLNISKEVVNLKKVKKIKCQDDILNFRFKTFYALVVLDEMLAQSDYFKHLEENNRYIDCDIAQEKYDIVYVSKSKKLLREKLSEYYYLCKGKKLIEIYDAAIVKCHIDETFDCVIHDEIVEYAQIDEDYFKELMFDIKSLQDINVLDLDILTKEHFNVCDGYNECEEGDLYRASTYLQNVSYDGIIIAQTILYNKQIDKYTIDIEDVESVMYEIIEVNNFGLLDKLGKLRLIKFEKDENGTLRCI